MTRVPHLEKKLATPIGDTSIGLQGKKCLSVLKGANRATPRPPFVSISSSECDSVDTNKKRNITQLPPGLWRNRVNVSSALSAAAKTIECVKPRCPNISLYLIPNLKPITSRSGMTEQAAPARTIVGESADAGRHTENASGTAG
jgi:hypothetical protein